MKDLLSNELQIGDTVIFAYKKERVMIGKIVAINKKIKIEHQRIEIYANNPLYDREVTYRYDWQVVKYNEVSHT